MWGRRPRLPRCAFASRSDIWTLTTVPGGVFGSNEHTRVHHAELPLSRTSTLHKLEDYGHFGSAFTFLAALLFRPRKVSLKTNHTRQPTKILVDGLLSL